MYNHQEIESKWQKFWQIEELNRAEDFSSKDKKYILDMFVYPSGDGLHVGHPEGQTATDILSRFYRFQGFNVLHPMGWDAFGLPAENFAIKKGVAPWVTTPQNIANFKRQIQSLGFSYDWDREVNTSDPGYYKWTQWLFLQLYKVGLAYKKEAPVNWCPKDQTVLANEQVVGGKCERCGTEVIQKNLEQWFFKVTQYAEELLKEIDHLDWPEPLKSAQRNWIGKSSGAEIDFKIKDSAEFIKVFTTRADTLFGATFCVLAPEHPLLEKLKNQIKNWSEVEQYQLSAQKKSELQRTDLNKDKTGVRLNGVVAINPANNEELPIFIADYVTMSYGTGAIMAVPAHDERDFEFASKFSLPIRQVICPLIKKETKDDKPTEKRDNVCAIVKDVTNNKILCLDWKKTGWHAFPMGGTDGQDLIEAAKREVLEETGYKNIKFIKKIGESFYQNFWRPHKDSNVFGKFDALFFELENNEMAEVAEKEKQQHEAVWIDENKVKDFMNVSGPELIWKRYLGEDKQCFADEGILINSGKFDGLSSAQAALEIAKKVGGKTTTKYRLRDWLVSRQRFWGAPIPIIYCEKCGAQGVPEKDLPVLLPDDVDFKPTGESPLTRSKKFQAEVKCPKCNEPAKREVDTLDTFVCSSWYFLRYADPKNDQEPFAKPLARYWLPVDVYVGGMEHAVGHLIFARFITKVLADQKHLTFREPFLKIRNQGLIMGEDGEKMSKSRGNVVNPDEVVANFGADSLRMYEMFMGPFADSKPWSTNNIMGVRRFLDKAHLLVTEQSAWAKTTDLSLEKVLQRTIKKVSEDIEGFNFNTAISALMILLNELVKTGSKPTQDQVERLVVILSPFAPHLAEELWSELGHQTSVFKAKWPKVEKKYLVDEEVKIAVQVNGKVRAEIVAAFDLSQKDLTKQALAMEAIQKYLQGQEPKKTIVVPNKLVNFVV